MARRLVGWPWRSELDSIRTGGVGEDPRDGRAEEGGLAPGNVGDLGIHLLTKRKYKVFYARIFDINRTAFHESLLTGKCFLNKTCCIQ